jgi:single-strand DNA-binding protein
LQTRKWTDQQGVEKYTTEVVLQRYRGEMTLLGGRGDSSSMGDSGGYSSNQVSHDQNPHAGGQSNPPPMRSANDMDDDIPF